MACSAALAAFSPAARQCMGEAQRQAQGAAVQPAHILLACLQLGGG